MNPCVRAFARACYRRVHVLRKIPFKDFFYLLKTMRVTGERYVHSHITHTDSLSERQRESRCVCDVCLV